MNIREKIIESLTELHPEIDDFSEIKLPSLFIIKDGNIVGYTDYSLEKSDDLDDKKMILKNKYIKLINMVDIF